MLFGSSSACVRFANTPYSSAGYAGNVALNESVFLLKKLSKLLFFKSRKDFKMQKNINNTEKIKPYELRGCCLIKGIYNELYIVAPESRQVLSQLFWPNKKDSVLLKDSEK